MRIIKPAVVAVSIATFGGLAAVEAPADSASSADTTATTDGQLSESERQMLQSAVARFEMVGLTLPDVDLSFHADPSPCKGNEGIFHGDDVPPKVLVCVPDHGTSASDLRRSRTLVHELAHAWESANLRDDDRSRLLADFGLEHWFSSSVPWDERGGERFAETLTWGLYDQIRRPVFVDVPCRKLHADFVTITGFAATGPVEPVCTPVSAVPLPRQNGWRG